MTYGHIKNVSTAQLGPVLSSLAASGICFNVTENNDGSWNVEITGV